jgi:deoxycytidine triphosphate deaminase
MAQILSDREIKKLIGDVLINADANLVSPNGIELRLGTEVRFLSTNEKKTIGKDCFINVHPGEAVLITSLEKLDFKKETIHKHFAGGMLMAIITPTTTMMREGMLQCATKVHAGYFGELNWGFRNSSSKDFIIQQGEPIFNLTIFLLQGNEVPEVPYGDNPKHKYQNTSGIMVSHRKIPADIPKEHIVFSSFFKLDPKVQLREAGHPFNYIGSELTQLQGKFELVNSGVEALKTKIDETKESILDKVDSLFQKKFLWAASLCIGAFSGLYATLGFLRQRTTFTPGETYLIAGVFALIVPCLGWFLFLRKRS